MGYGATKAPILAKELLAMMADKDILLEQSEHTSMSCFTFLSFIAQLVIH